MTDYKKPVVGEDVYDEDDEKVGTIQSLVNEEDNDGDPIFTVVIEGTDGEGDTFVEEHDIQWSLSNDRWELM